MKKISCLLVIPVLILIASGCQSPQDYGDNPVIEPKNGANDTLVPPPETSYFPATNVFVVFKDRIWSGPYYFYFMKKTREIVKVDTSNGQTWLFMDMDFVNELPDSLYRKYRWDRLVRFKLLFFNPIDSNTFLPFSGNRADKRWIYLVMRKMRQNQEIDLTPALIKMNFVARSIDREKGYIRCFIYCDFSENKQIFTKDLFIDVAIKYKE